MRCRLAIAAIMLALSAGASADVLMTDISEREIGIDARFTGTDLLLFGSIGDYAAGEERGDIVVVVRGPPTDMVMRQKSEIAGIWVNTESVTWDGVPGFYAIYSNLPLDDFVDIEYRDAYAIGFDHIPFRTEASLTAEQMRLFRAATIARLEADGLYIEDEAGVTILGDQLFRTQVSFPSNVPTGDYIADIYLLRSGLLITIQSSPVFVDKSGFQEIVTDLANDYPALYGILAVLIAALGGWLAGVIFSRE